VKKQKGVVLMPDYFENETKLRTLLDELDKNKYKHSLLLSKVFLSQSKNIVPKLSSLLKEVNISRSVVNTFVKKGILEIVDIEVDRSVGNEESLSVRDESKLTLSDEQQHCLEQIKRTIANGETKPILIKGVTGSGKTLIYMHIIAEMLEKGKNILLLVPEISLTPQLIDRFRNTFGDNIVALHSRMSDGERFDAWRLIRLGEKQIIIGARSAVFAPVRNLGLIIVDEEHDHSYKQDSPVPRYNGRDTAIMRANFAGIPVILGSATPSLESMYNAEIGKYKLLQINRRADGAVLPEISLVDKIEAKKSGQMNGAISKYLLDEIKERLKNKEGIILFQNRRGFASFLECPDCGYVPMCKNCDVALTYHKSKNQLRCHYCGYSTHSFNACPACGYAGLKELGYGTQRIEDELEQLLHEEGFAPVIQRVDLDSTSRKGALRKIFTGFISGEIDILIGTQMVSKGLDFERVTLVGVIDADLQMFLPDFRATERTFQLLTQVAGRSGRTSAKPGKVVIQTAHPRHLALRAVFASSYDMFYKEELENRRKAVYPPFVRFVVIEFSGKDEATVEAKANDFYKLIPASDSFEMLGVTLPLIPKLQNRYRRMIIIKSDKQKDKSGKTLRRSLAAALQQYNVKHSSSSVFLKIDIDAFSTF
jgi:primosomal protein N' (replication factor Y)